MPRRTHDQQPCRQCGDRGHLTSECPHAHTPENGWAPVTSDREASPRVPTSLSRDFVFVYRVREHVAALRRQGVGLRTIADAAHFSRSGLQQILSGKAKTVRACTAAAILAVDASAAEGGAFVDAGPSRGHLAELERHGWTLADVAAAVNCKRVAARLDHPRVLARVAHAIEKLLRRARRDDDDQVFEDPPPICPHCATSHEPANRRRLIARMAADGVDPVDIIDARPCFYCDGQGINGNGYRMLMRDLAILRGERLARRAA